MTAFLIIRMVEIFFDCNLIITQNIIKTNSSCEKIGFEGDSPKSFLIERT
jgi:hypothetical protein